MQNFRKLQVWEKSHNLTLRVYELTSQFPREETSQIRRSCASIPTNIAEGCGRKSAADFASFLQIAMGPQVKPSISFFLRLSSNTSLRINILS